MKRGGKRQTAFLDSAAVEQRLAKKHKIQQKEEEEEDEEELEDADPKPPPPRPRAKRKPRQDEEDEEENQSMRGSDAKRHKPIEVDSKEELTMDCKELRDWLRDFLSRQKTTASLPVHRFPDEDKDLVKKVIQALHKRKDLVVNGISIPTLRNALPTGEDYITYDLEFSLPAQQQQQPQGEDLLVRIYPDFMQNIHSVASQLTHLSPDLPPRFFRSPSERCVITLGSGRADSAAATATNPTLLTISNFDCVRYVDFLEALQHPETPRHQNIFKCLGIDFDDLVVPKSTARGVVVNREPLMWVLKYVVLQLMIALHQLHKQHRYNSRYGFNVMISESKKNSNQDEKQERFFLPIRLVELFRAGTIRGDDLDAKQIEDIISQDLELCKRMVCYTLIRLCGKLFYQRVSFHTLDPGAAQWALPILSEYSKEKPPSDSSEVLSTVKAKELLEFLHKMLPKPGTALKLNCFQEMLTSASPRMILACAPETIHEFDTKHTMYHSIVHGRIQTQVEMHELELSDADTAAERDSLFVSTMDTSYITQHIYKLVQDFMARVDDKKESLPLLFLQTTVAQLFTSIFSRSSSSRNSSSRPNQELCQLLRAKYNHELLKEHKELLEANIERTSNGKPMLSHKFDTLLVAFVILCLRMNSAPHESTLSRVLARETLDERQSMFVCEVMVACAMDMQDLSILSFVDKASLTRLTGKNKASIAPVVRNFIRAIQSPAIYQSLQTVLFSCSAATRASEKVRIDEVAKVLEFLIHMANLQTTDHKASAPACWHPTTSHWQQVLDQNIAIHANQILSWADLFSMEDAYGLIRKMAGSSSSSSSSSSPNFSNCKFCTLILQEFGQDNDNSELLWRPHLRRDVRVTERKDDKDVKEFLQTQKKHQSRMQKDGPVESIEIQTRVMDQLRSDTKSFDDHVRILNEKFIHIPDISPDKMLRVWTESHGKVPRLYLPVHSGFVMHTLVQEYVQKGNVSSNSFDGNTLENLVRWLYTSDAGSSESSVHRSFFRGMLLRGSYVTALLNNRMYKFVDKAGVTDSSECYEDHMYALQQLAGKVLSGEVFGEHNTFPFVIAGGYQKQREGSSSEEDPGHQIVIMFTEDAICFANTGAGAHNARVDSKTNAREVLCGIRREAGHAERFANKQILILVHALLNIYPQATKYDWLYDAQEEENKGYSGRVAMADSKRVNQTYSDMMAFQIGMFWMDHGQKTTDFDTMLNGLILTKAPLNTTQYKNWKELEQNVKFLFHDPEFKDVMQETNNKKFKKDVRAIRDLLAETESKLLKFQDGKFSSSTWKKLKESKTLSSMLPSYKRHLAEVTVKLYDRYRAAVSMARRKLGPLSESSMGPETKMATDRFTSHFSATQLGGSCVLMSYMEMFQFVTYSTVDEHFGIDTSIQTEKVIPYHSATSQLQTSSIWSDLRSFVLPRLCVRPRNQQQVVRIFTSQKHSLVDLTLPNQYVNAENTRNLLDMIADKYGDRAILYDFHLEQEMTCSQYLLHAEGATGALGAPGAAPPRIPNRHFFTVLQSHRLTLPRVPDQKESPAKLMFELLMKIKSLLEHHREEELVFGRLADFLQLVVAVDVEHLGLALRASDEEAGLLVVLLFKASKLLLKVAQRLRVETKQSKAAKLSCEKAVCFTLQTCFMIMGIWVVLHSKFHDVMVAKSRDDSRFRWAEPLFWSIPTKLAVFCGMVIMRADESHSDFVPNSIRPIYASSTNALGRINRLSALSIRKLMAVHPQRNQDYDVEQDAEILANFSSYFTFRAISEADLKKWGLELHSILQSPVNFKTWYINNNVRDVFESGSHASSEKSPEIQVLLLDTFQSVGFRSIRHQQRFPVAFDLRAQPMADLKKACVRDKLFLAFRHVFGAAFNCIQFVTGDLLHFAQEADMDTFASLYFLNAAEQTPYGIVEESEILKHNTDPENGGIYYIGRSLSISAALRSPELTLKDVLKEPGSFRAAVHRLQRQIYHNAMDQEESLFSSRENATESKEAIRHLLDITFENNQEALDFMNNETCKAICSEVCMNKCRDPNVTANVEWMNLVLILVFAGTGGSSGGAANMSFFQANADAARNWIDLLCKCHLDDKNGTVSIESHPFLAYSAALYLFLVSNLRLPDELLEEYKQKLLKCIRLFRDYFITNQQQQQQQQQQNVPDLIIPLLADYCCHGFDQIDFLSEPKEIEFTKGEFNRTIGKLLDNWMDSSSSRFTRATPRELMLPEEGKTKAWTFVNGKNRSVLVESRSNARIDAAVKSTLTAQVRFTLKRLVTKAGAGAQGPLAHVPSLQGFSSDASYLDPDQYKYYVSRINNNGGTIWDIHHDFIQVRHGHNNNNNNNNNNKANEIVVVPRQDILELTENDFTQQLQYCNEIWGMLCKLRPVLNNVCLITYDVLDNVYRIRISHCDRVFLEFRPGAEGALFVHENRRFQIMTTRNNNHALTRWSVCSVLDRKSDQYGASKSAPKGATRAALLVNDNVGGCISFVAERNREPSVLFLVSLKYFADLFLRSQVLEKCIRSIRPKQQQQSNEAISMGALDTESDITISLCIDVDPSGLHIRASTPLLDVWMLLLVSQKFNLVWITQICLQHISCFVSSDLLSGSSVIMPTNMVQSRAARRGFELGPVIRYWKAILDTEKNSSQQSQMLLLFPQLNPWVFALNNYYFPWTENLTISSLVRANRTVESDPTLFPHKMPCCFPSSWRASINVSIQQEWSDIVLEIKSSLGAPLPLLPAPDSSVAADLPDGLHTPEEEDRKMEVDPWEFAAARSQVELDAHQHWREFVLASRASRFEVQTQIVEKSYRVDVSDGFVYRASADKKQNLQAKLPELIDKLKQHYTKITSVIRQWTLGKFKYLSLHVLWWWINNHHEDSAEKIHDASMIIIVLYEELWLSLTLNALQELLELRKPSHLIYYRKLKNVDYRLARRNGAHNELPYYVILFELASRTIVTHAQLEMVKTHMIPQMMGGSAAAPRIQNIVMGQGKSTVMTPMLAIASCFGGPAAAAAAARFTFNFVTQPDHLTAETTEKLKHLFARLAPSHVRVHRFSFEWLRSQSGRNLRFLQRWFLSNDVSSPEEHPVTHMIVLSDAEYKLLYAKLTHEHNLLNDTSSVFRQGAVQWAPTTRVMTIADEIDSIMRPSSSELNIPAAENQVHFVQQYETKRLAYLTHCDYLGGGGDPWVQHAAEEVGRHTGNGKDVYHLVVYSDKNLSFLFQTEEKDYSNLKLIVLERLETQIWKIHWDDSKKRSYVFASFSISAVSAETREWTDDNLVSGQIGTYEANFILHTIPPTRGFSAFILHKDQNRFMRAYTTAILDLFFVVNRYIDTRKLQIHAAAASAFHDEKFAAELTAKMSATSPLKGDSAFQKVITALAVKISNDVRSCLSLLQFNVHYGFTSEDQQDEDFLARPFRFQETPLKSSRHTDAEKILILTILSYLHTGLRRKDISRMRSDALSEHRYLAPFLTELPYMLPAEFRQKEVSDEKLFVDHLRIKYRFDRHVMRHFLEQVVVAKYFRVSTSQQTITPMHPFANGFSPYKVAYSGTVNTRIPVTFSSAPAPAAAAATEDHRGSVAVLFDPNIQVDAHATLKVTNALYGKGDARDEPVTTFQATQVEEILTWVIMKMDCNGIIDTVPIFNDYELKQKKKRDGAGGAPAAPSVPEIIKLLAEIWMRKSPHSQAIVWKTAANETAAYSVSRGLHSVSSKDLENDVENRYFFCYDQSKLVGVDIAQSNTCRFAVVVSKDNKYDELSQAAFRARHLDAGQALEFVFVVPGRATSTAFTRSEMLDKFKENEKIRMENEELRLRMQTIYFLADVFHLLEHKMYNKPLFYGPTVMGLEGSSERLYDFVNKEVLRKGEIDWKSPLLDTHLAEFKAFLSSPNGRALVSGAQLATETSVSVEMAQELKSSVSTQSFIALNSEISAMIKDGTRGNIFPVRTTRCTIPDMLGDDNDGDDDGDKKNSARYRFVITQSPHPKALYISNLCTRLFSSSRFTAGCNLLLMNEDMFPLLWNRNDFVPGAGGSPPSQQWQYDFLTEFQRDLSQIPDVKRNVVPSEASHVNLVLVGCDFMTGFRCTIMTVEEWQLIEIILQRSEGKHRFCRIIQWVLTPHKVNLLQGKDSRIFPNQIVFRQDSMQDFLPFLVFKMLAHVPLNIKEEISCLRAIILEEDGPALFKSRNRQKISNLLFLLYKFGSIQTRGDPVRQLCSNAFLEILQADGIAKQTELLKRFPDLAITENPGLAGLRPELDRFVASMLLLE